MGMCERICKVIMAEWDCSEMRQMTIFCIVRKYGIIISIVIESYRNGPSIHHFHANLYLPNYTNPIAHVRSISFDALYLSVYLNISLTVIVSDSTSSFCCLFQISAASVGEKRNVLL